MRRTNSIVFLIILCAAVGAEERRTIPTVNWPSYRGPQASGVSQGYATATTWDVEKGTNVRWKTPIPGLSHSSPVVWGNRLFVATAVSSGNADLKIGLYGSGDSSADVTSQKWNIYCLDKRTGKILWDRTAKSGIPRSKRHTKATYANTTVATDGTRLVAFFGSEGMYCYDLNGKLLWAKDLGVLDIGPYDAPTYEWGYASSPILHDGRVYIQCDTLGDKGFLASFDAQTGREIWRTKRDDVATWSTPAVFDDGVRTLMVVNGYKHIGGYDARTGKEIWRLTGGGDIPVPTPIVGDGLIYIQNAHGKMNPIYAIKTTATGDITPKSDETSNAGIAWYKQRGGGYLQSPLVLGDRFYSCQITGVLTCYEAKTGKQLYQERLGTGRTGFTSSPVAADGKLYIASEEGDVYVIQDGPEFKLLSKNPLGEICMATPAISEGMLFYRTRENVVAISPPSTRPR